MGQQTSDYIISEINSVVPNSVNNLSLTFTESSITLHWINPDTFGQTITGYQIWRSNTSGTEILIATTTGGITTSYLDTDNIIPGNTYFYKIKVVINAISGVFSSEVSASIPLWQIRTFVPFLDWIRAIISNNGQYCFVIADENTVLYRSIDRGANWTVTDFAPNEIMEIATSDDCKYVILTLGSSSKYIYYSSDYGASFLQKTVSDVAISMYTCAISDDGTKIYVVDSTNGILKYSGNSGVSWTDIYTVGVGVNNFVKCNITGSSVVINAGTTICWSHDNGTTWNTYDLGGIASIISIDLNVDGTMMIVALANSTIIYTADEWLTKTVWAVGFVGTNEVSMDNNGNAIVTTNEGLRYRAYNAEWILVDDIDVVAYRCCHISRTNDYMICSSNENSRIWCYN